MSILSSKINVWYIIKGHLNTIKGTKGERLISDYFTFLVLPLLAATLVLLFNKGLNTDIAGLLVNFGAILTALLLSVLVLVYDQESKLSDKNNELYTKKKTLLKELYFNISYAIISSLILVFICLTYYVLLDASVILPIMEFKLNFNSHILAPITAFITTNLLLTIVMIVKRMHTMLIANH